MCVLVVLSPVVVSLSNMHWMTKIHVNWRNIYKYLVVPPMLISWPWSVNYQGNSHLGGIKRRAMGELVAEGLHLSSERLNVVSMDLFSRAKLLQKVLHLLLRYEYKQQVLSQACTCNVAWPSWSSSDDPSTLAIISCSCWTKTMFDEGVMDEVTRTIGLSL